MTIEEYNIASGYIARLQTLENSMYDIKNIIQTSDTANWSMEIRPNKSHSLNVIDHKVLLPMVLSKQCEEYEELKKALEEI